MKTANFNKTQIMRRAWNCYRKHSVTMTFSQCLKWSWKKAWEELRKTSVGAWVAATSRKKHSAWEKALKENQRIYRNVVFGYNDWAIDYGRNRGYGYRRFAC